MRLLLFYFEQQFYVNFKADWDLARFIPRDHPMHHTVFMGIVLIPELLSLR